MFSRTYTSVLSALFLSTIAGTVMSQVPERSSLAPAAIATTVDFWSANRITDRDVVNNNGEEIATVSDLIMDRGSGRVEYAIVKTSVAMSKGRREIAIPYASLGWDAAKEGFLLASTSEQLNQFPEYSPEDWKAMKDRTAESSSENQNTLYQRMATDAASASDPYATSLDMRTKERFEGEITNVERMRTSSYGEQVVITIKTNDGASRRVALGPSWYVNGTSAAPMRGEKAVVDTIALPRDPDALLAATHFRTNGRDLNLRKADGSAEWALKSIESGGRRYSLPHSRYMLLSQLPGTKVDCRGEECGKIDDVIIDRNSGQIGFLSIDPNKNFLGISDTKRLIPWSVANATIEGPVKIDASKEMILASLETPSDGATLNHGTHAERVYRAFGVPTPRFESPAPSHSGASDLSGPWGAQGSIVAALERGSSQMMTGKVIDITEMKFANGTASAHALRMRVDGSDNREETVLLGPAAYIENQKPMCKAGETVKVDACRTTVDGKRVWIARSVECQNSRTVLLDGDNAPAWARR
jgi:sporulation protein YlmC with PRC-barrel domain